MRSPPTRKTLDRFGVPDYNPRAAVFSSVSEHLPVFGFLPGTGYCTKDLAGHIRLRQCPGLRFNLTTACQARVANELKGRDTPVSFYHGERSIAVLHYEQIVDRTQTALSNI